MPKPLPVPDEPTPAPPPPDPEVGKSARPFPAATLHGGLERRESESPRPFSRQQRRRSFPLPLFLFLATCGSTFFVGATAWMPLYYLLNWSSAARMISLNWQQGLTYMVALLAILLTHEMGHYLAARRYGIPASYPMFIPVPVNAVGTMGAVIGMDSLRAHRREMFDIGLAGPLAGLVVAIPIMWVGVNQLDAGRLTAAAARNDMGFYSPWIARLMMGAAHPGIDPQLPVSIRQLNPYFMAGWVGMLVTGLNMLPISQLDGGHTVYALFGRKSKYVARAFLMLAIAYIVVMEAYFWSLMLILVVLLGVDHPPTAGDDVPLDPFRRWIGYASMTIPIFCFAPRGIAL